MVSTVDLGETLHLYVRREGGHLIGLCAETHTIIPGATIEEIVEKTKAVVADSQHLRVYSTSIAVHASESLQAKPVS